MYGIIYFGNVYCEARSTLNRLSSCLHRLFFLFFCFGVGSVSHERTMNITLYVQIFSTSKYTGTTLGYRALFHFHPKKKTAQSYRVPFAIHSHGSVFHSVHRLPSNNCTSKSKLRLNVLHKLAIWIGTNLGIKSVYIWFCYSSNRFFALPIHTLLYTRTHAHRHRPSCSKFFNPTCNLCPQTIQSILFSYEIYEC